MRFVLILLLIPFFVYKVPTDDRAKEVQKRIYSLPGSLNVNYGGCGFFALYLHDYLNRVQVRNEIVFITEGKRLKHVAIKVQDYYIDSNGLFTGLSMFVFSKGSMTIHSREQLVYELQTRQWNEKFLQKDTVIIKKIFLIKNNKNENRN